MALFQPSNISPDVRSGLGYGTIDARKTWTVSWQVNGASALESFSVGIYENTSASALVYTTGQLTDGCPFYGTMPSGDTQLFSYTMPAVLALRNGGSYKLVIKQWWDTGSITQNSASVFLTRATPSFRIEDIGTNNTVYDKTCTFVGDYSQVDGDVLNWFRWQIANADDLDNPIYDTGNVSGTMDIQCTFDGLFTGQNYAVSLTAQTQSGVFCDAGWTTFGVDYGEPIPSENVTATCAQGTNAVLISWKDLDGTLITPVQRGTLTYDGSSQSPTFDHYDPTQMTMGGTLSGVDAGDYTATFTPNPGYSWSAGSSTAVSWSIYRKGQDGQFVHLADVPAARGELYDYGAGSRQGPFTYYVFPIDGSGNLGVPLESNSVNPCYQSWSLMECVKTDSGYSVVAEYLFRYNFSSGNISNNNSPSVEKNFSRYPTYFRAPQNYRSGSLSYLIGVVDIQAKYSDTLSMRERLFALSTTKNALFLKSRKGDVIYVGISEPVTAQISDNTFEQAQTVAIQWVEIGPTDNLLKLTALDNAASTDEMLSPNLVLDPPSVAVSVGQTFTVDATWFGNGALSAAPANGEDVSIAGTTSPDIITVTKNVAGKSVIPVSVSPTGQYTGQTVALTVEAVGIPVPIPTLASPAMTYNGTLQTPSFNNYDPAAMTMSGDVNATNAGSYSTTFTLKSGFIWEDGTIGDQTIPWSIAKASPNLSVSTNTISIHEGETATLSISKQGDGIVTATSSDDTIATITVIDTSTATKVNPPSQSGTLNYNGSSQSPTWNGYNSSIMTLSGTTSGTNPGSYPAVFTLADGYVWSDMPTGLIGNVLGVSEGSVTITVSVSETNNYLPDSVTVSVTVLPAEQQVPIPSQSDVLVWDGTTQSPTWNDYDSSKMTIGGQTSGTNAGTYTASFTLNSGYVWSDGTSGTKNVGWEIGKYRPTLTGTPTTATISVGQSATFTYSYDGDGTVGADDTAEALSVSLSGNIVTVTGVETTGAASTVLQIYAPETQNCYATSTGTSITVKVT